MSSDLDILKSIGNKTVKPVCESLSKRFLSLKEKICMTGLKRRYSASEFSKFCTKDFEKIRNDKGVIGEYILYDTLRREKGKWLFNLYLPDKDEETEVDSVFICGRGIFIFESKNFSGRIYGLPSQTEWRCTCSTDKGIRQMKFFNPLMQNGAHLHAVWRIIGDEFPVIPIVVFGRDSELYTPAKDDAANELTTVGKLKKTVKQYEDGVLDNETVNAVYDFLLPYANASENKKAEHIAHVRKKKF